MSPRQSVVIAGGIGSGKSTTVAALSQLGWSVIDADRIGHEVLLEPRVAEAVANRWPGVVVAGEVSRPALAGVVFGRPSELSTLEEITHPLIVGRISRSINDSSRPTAVEVSVLKVVRTEWGPLVIVHAPLALRKKRALERGMVAADVEARMAVQPPDSDLLARADFVIPNHGTVEDLRKSVRRFQEWTLSA